MICSPKSVREEIRCISAGQWHVRLRAILLALLLMAGLLAAGFPTSQAHALSVQPDGCYDGYVLVPGDSTYGTSDFCVAQYEAKDVGGVATSQADGTPWVSISQTDAKTTAAAACPGGNCHLITDKEWMTIAANVERQASNWSGGSVGSGCLYIGNNNSDTTCGYIKGGVDYGTGRNTKARYTLSNGSQIWDLSGNVMEWTDATVQQQNEPQPSDWSEYRTVTNFGTLSYINPLANTTGLPAGASNWASAQRLGQLLSSFSGGSSTVNSFSRGGYYNYAGTNVGPFALILILGPTDTQGFVGFRVAQTPVTSPTQITQRSIELSSSAASADNVTYHVSFQAGSAYSLRTIIVDFCSNSPIIGDSCTKPTGIDIGTPANTANMLLGGVANNDYSTMSPYGGRNVQMAFTNPVSIAKGEIISFDITNVKNPSSTGTFYGRILLYGSSTVSYTPTDPGSYLDYGATALSITPTVNITALVQETLTFCVYHTSCGDSPAVTLGHGTPLVLDSNAVDTGTASFSLSTNAGRGAVVTARGSTLTSSGSTIPAVAGGSGSGGTLSPGTAAFGLAVSTPGALTIPLAYQGDGTVTGHYAFDTTSTPNLSSTYGQPLASSSGVLDNSVSTVTFAATASPTTPAGVYTTDLGLVATGTF